MNVSGVSMTDVLAQTYSALSSSRLQAQIGVAVLKQIQNNQQQQANAVVQMIEQSAAIRLDPAAQRIDLRV